MLQVVYRLVEEQDPDILDRFTVTTVNGAAVLNLVGQLDYETRYSVACRYVLLGMCTCCLLFASSIYS